MADSLHTPGPWFVKPISRTTRACVITSDVTNAARDICNVLGLVDEADANTRLIAAAPELLEALKELRDVAAAMARVIARFGRTRELVAELDTLCIRSGFGVRAQNAIAKADASEAKNSHA